VSYVARAKKEEGALWCAFVCESGGVGEVRARAFEERGARCSTVCDTQMTDATQMHACACEVRAAAARPAGPARSLGEAGPSGRLPDGWARHGWPAAASALLLSPRATAPRRSCGRPAPLLTLARPPPPASSHGQAVSSARLLRRRPIRTFIARAAGDRGEDGRADGGGAQPSSPPPPPSRPPRPRTGPAGWTTRERWVVTGLAAGGILFGPRLLLLGAVALERGAVAVALAVERALSTAFLSAFSLLAAGAGVALAGAAVYFFVLEEGRLGAGGGGGGGGDADEGDGFDEDGE
jgi:hypothetical protein